MTRTDVMASSRPQAVEAPATTRSGSSRARRRLVILPVMLALGLASVAPALAASPTTGYAEPGAKTPTPKSGTSPSKSTKKPTTTTTTPTKAVEPATTSTGPTATEAKASTLPFTGFDLRWTVGGGLLLIAAGGSIMVMQRRQRRDGGL
jgi:hypothetical protein